MIHKKKFLTMRSRTDADVPEDDATDLPRATPILVAGHLDTWWCWGAVGSAGIVLALAVTAHWLRHPLRQQLTIVSFPVLALVAACFGWQLWNRRWLTWNDDSLDVVDRSGERTLLDTDVAALSISRDYRHSFGRIVAESHVLRIWSTLSPGAPLVFEARAGLSDPFPYGSLVDRLQERLERQALAVLRGQGTLIRQDWSWISGVISAGSQGRRLETTLGEIAAVAVNTDDLRVWTGSDPVPRFRLSQKSQDVWLLGRLLSSHRGPPGAPDLLPATGLGRILYEARPRSSAIMATMLSGFSAMVAALSIFGAITLRLIPLAILGVGTGMGAILLGSMARRLWQSVFRLHERGVSQRGLAGDHALEFGDIHQFVFDARRQYSRGRYLGTVFTLVFASDTKPGHGILHTERSPYETDELARIRDRVSEEMADVLAARLANQGELVWTRELSIRNSALHFQPRSWLRWRESAITVPLDEIQGFDVIDGGLYIWSDSRDRSLFKARTAEANFFPGLLIFEQILAHRGIMVGTNTDDPEAG